jgi:hypothetical protein
MRTFRRSVLVVVMIASASLVSSTPASAAPTWAPAATASIHPGVQTESPSGQCTANFVFFDATDVYIGQAAHCTSTGGATDTDGCLAGSLPLGTEVTVGGASQPGTLAYNSWLTMQAQDETDPDICQFNDFALVRLHPDDVGRVNPSIPFWGGPTGINTTGTRLLEHVYSYGNSSLRLGLPLLSPKKGFSNGDLGGGWAHSVSTLTPGIPGDSGSAFLDKNGRALGVLSTLRVGLPGGVDNVVGDIRHELDYLRANTAFADMELAGGTVPFNGRRLPLGI